MLSRMQPIAALRQHPTLSFGVPVPEVLTSPRLWPAQAAAGYGRVAPLQREPPLLTRADDPDGPAVLSELTAAWRALPHQTRRRVQLASLPVVDVQENAAIVNALQRHAAVVVQKSLQEGFGLTVAEAMWKARPVVASAVGGIVDQIDDGRDGVLVQDPSDPDAFAAALAGVLADPARAAALGEAGHARVRDHLLNIRQLADYARLLESIG